MKNCINCGELIGDNATTCFACHYNYTLKRVVHNSEINNSDNLQKIKEKEQLELLKTKSKQIMNNPRYEYDMVIINDKNNGTINYYNIKETLMEYSGDGWRLHTIFTNEIGKESTSAGFGGFSSSTNATRNEIVMIFERCIRKEIE